MDRHSVWVFGKDLAWVAFVLLPENWDLFSYHPPWSLTSSKLTSTPQHPDRSQSGRPDLSHRMTCCLQSSHTPWVSYSFGKKHPGKENNQTIVVPDTTSTEKISSCKLHWKRKLSVCMCVCVFLSFFLSCSQMPVEQQRPKDIPAEKEENYQEVAGAVVDRTSSSPYPQTLLQDLHPQLQQNKTSQLTFLSVKIKLMWHRLGIQQQVYTPGPLNILSAAFFAASFFASVAVVPMPTLYLLPPTIHTRPCGNCFMFGLGHSSHLSEQIISSLPFFAAMWSQKIHTERKKFTWVSAVLSYQRICAVHPPRLSRFFGTALEGAMSYCNLWPAFHSRLQKCWSHCWIKTKNRFRKLLRTAVTVPLLPTTKRWSTTNLAPFSFAFRLLGPVPWGNEGQPQTLNLQ